MCKNPENLSKTAKPQYNTRQISGESDIIIGIL